MRDAGSLSASSSTGPRASRAAYRRWMYRVAREWKRAQHSHARVPSPCGEHCKQFAGRVGSTQSPLQRSLP